MPAPENDQQKPEPFKAFLDALKSIHGAKQDKASLKRIVEEMNTLIHNNVDYYARVGKRHSSRATITRWTAIVFGTIGVLAPLLGGINDCFKGLVGWGYPALAIAGAAMLADRSFGYTRGHIRYVIARLELKHLMTNFQVQWSLWLANNPQEQLQPHQLKEVEALLQTFVDRAHEIVMAETAVWGIAVVEDMQELKNLIGQNSQTKSDASKDPV
ncbi:SLATT domain-containing protein [Pseudomonas sp. B33.4]|uniref:SLATT domain-containing protein n=1 Tax=Pseudomonas sp. B33.4 TaxID=3104265 RepID=UPI002ADEF8F3|nr:SLATT domain-containing protein [Pseudomonas sp. B33.4]